MFEVVILWFLVVYALIQSFFHFFDKNPEQFHFYAAMTMIWYQQIRILRIEEVLCDEPNT